MGDPLPYVLKLLCQKVQQHQAEQRAILEAALLQNQDAMLGMGDRVGQIYRSLQEQLQGLREASRATRLMAETLRALFRAVPPMLTDLQGRLREQQGVADQIQRYVEAIPSLSDHIGAIAMALRLLSVNMQIEAAHAGTTQSPVHVVAQSMNNLAQDSRRTAEHIGRLAQGLIDSLTTMAADTERMVAAGASGSAALLALIADYQEECEQGAHQVETILDTLQRFGTQASTHSEAIIGHLQSPDRLSQRVVSTLRWSELLGAQLQELTNLLSAHPQPLTEADLQQAFAQAEARARALLDEPRIVADPRAADALPAGEVHFL